MPSQKLIKQGEKRRDKMVKFIAQYHTKNGYAPTFSEIGEAVGLTSTNSVSDHIERLVAEGRVKVAPGVPRSISVIE